MKGDETLISADGEKSPRGYEYPADTKKVKKLMCRLI
jgi:hypothetical protein